MLPDKMQGDATVRTVFRRLKLSADASPAGEARTNRVSGVIVGGAANVPRIILAWSGGGCGRGGLRCRSPSLPRLF